MGINLPESINSMVVDAGITELSLGDAIDVSEIIYKNYSRYYPPKKQSNETRAEWCNKHKNMPMSFDDIERMGILTPKLREDCINDLKKYNSEKIN